MSIRTDGLIEASPFKVTDSVAAGFVKNDASGNLLFGQAASAWDLVEFKVFSGSVPAIHSFDAVLDGDVDDTYQIMFQGSGVTTGGNSRGSIIFNGLAATVDQRFVSTQTWTTGQSANFGVRWQVWNEFGSTSRPAFYGRAIVHAKTGKVRTGESWMSAERTFSGSQRTFETHFSQRWNDTTTNITSIGFEGQLGARVSYGWLYKIKTA